MSKLKKNGLIITLFFVTILFVALFIDINSFQAQASTVKTNLITDTFSGENISNDFLLNNAEVEKDYYAMHFEKLNSYGSAIVFANYKLSNYAKFIFDIKSLQYSTDSVMWIAFGGDNYSSMQFDYERCLWVQSTNSVLCQNNGEEFSPKDEDVVYYQHNKNLFEQSDGKLLQIVIEVEKTSTNVYSFSIKYLINGEQFDTTISYSDISLTENKYVSINSFNYSYDLISCSIKNSSDEDEFFDDFSKNTLAYYGKSIVGKNWYANSSSLSEDIVRIGEMGTLSLKGDSSIIGKYKLNNSAKCLVSYRVSAKASISNISNNAQFCISFGMQSLDLSLDKTLIFEQNENSIIVYWNEGETKTKIKTLLKSFIERQSDIVIDFCDDYSVKISIDGVEFSVYNVDYDGYFGFATLKNDGEIKVNLDDIVIDGFDSIVYTSQDYSNSFKGTKIDATNTELPYINDQKYFLGNGVTIEEGYLSFYDSNEYSNFAILKKYDEFALQFDVEINSTGTTGQKFGLSVGKSSPALFYEKCSTVSFFYNNYVNGVEPTTSLKAYNCSLSDGSVEADSKGYQFWPSVTTVEGKSKRLIKKYNFLFIVQNRSVEVYYKADDEDYSQLSVLRAKFIDLDTDGYMSIFGSNGISFDVTNFKITNLGLFEKESNGFDEIYSFNNKNCDLDITGDYTIDNGMLSMTDGSFALDISNKNFLSLIRINRLYGDLIIKLSDTQKIVINGLGESIALVSLDKTETVNLVKKINFDVGYTNLSLRIIDNVISLGFSKNERPNDEIYANVISFVVGDDINSSCTIFSPNQVDIDFLCAYNFAKPYTANTYNYDDDPNNGNPWIVKPLDVSIKTNGGCNAIININGKFNVYIVALFISVITFLLKRRKNDEKNN